VGQVFKILNVQAQQRRPFGRIAVELGFLTEEGLADLLQAQARCNKSLGDILVEMGAIDRRTLEAEAARCPHDVAEGESV
jgi:hypothetical protein